MEDSVDVPFIIKMGNTVEILNVKTDVTDYFFPPQERRVILPSLFLSDFQRGGSESLPFYSSDTGFAVVILKEEVLFKEDVVKKSREKKSRGSGSCWDTEFFLYPAVCWQV
ncbi:MAG: hypothetical protein ACP5PQ_03645 [Thermoproteota archaeon]